MSDESLEKLEPTEIAGSIDEGLSHDEAAAELEERWSQQETQPEQPQTDYEPSYFKDAPEPEPASSSPSIQESQLNQAVAEHQQQVAALQGAAQATDWNELRQRDPDAFVQKQHQFQQYAQALAQQEQAIMGAASNVQLSAEARKLQNAIPAWRDSKVADREKAELRSWLVEQGIAETMVDSIRDANQVVVARKAMLADRRKHPSKFKTKTVQALKGRLNKGRYSRAEQKILRDKPHSMDATQVKLMRILK